MNTLTRLILILTLSVASAIGQTKGIRVVSVKDAKGQSIDLYEQSYALLVGVSKYTAGWPSLESVPSEMDKIETALKQNGFTVRKVIDPNGEQLTKAFEQFVKDYGYDKGNRLLFVYSGHGWSRKNGEQGFLVPSDAPDPQKDEKGFLRHALDMTDILAWCKKMEAKHALFLFDSCFSGAIFKTRALPEKPPHITALTTKPVRQFIAAGEAGQVVPAKSVFATCFLRGLSGEADLSKDGFITGTELGMYLHDKVMYYKTGQTPQYGKMRDPDLDEGDFVFLVNPPSVEPLVTTGRRGIGKLTIDGGTYEGEIINGKANGQGVWTDANGAKYVGEFNDDKCDGQGTFMYPNGTKYAGAFKDDKYNGQGTFTLPDGAKYVGEFKNGKEDGQGTWTYPNGMKYVGEWKDGKYNGQGTLTFLDGTKYAGAFKDGEYNGQGTYTFASGGKYVGEFKNGKEDGQGTWTYTNGLKYVGAWKDGFHNGQGTMTLSSGQKYVGEWKDGKRNGQGKMTFKDGSELSGEWKDDIYQDK